MKKKSKSKKLSKNKRKLLQHLSKSTVERYKRKVVVDPNWVCYKNPLYDPTTASKQEGRFNASGEAAFYIASGVDCAQMEVPNWAEKDLYKVNSGEIYVFDLPAFSQDQGCYDDFLQAKESGGYNICQELAYTLKNDYSISGVYYNSHKALQVNETGYCIAILPLSGDTIGDTFFFIDPLGKA